MPDAKCADCVVSSDKITLLAFQQSGLENEKPVRAGIFVEIAIPKMQSYVRSELIEICRPDGAGFVFGRGSTKMPRLRRWVCMSVFIFPNSFPPIEKG